MGLLDPLYYAVSWIIVQFHKLFSLFFDPNGGWAWGLSIVCLVLVIRAALIPLFVKQIKSSRNMAILQPKIKEIQEKYKHDRERQSQELMKLYKETGTNPFASCLPILVQMPFFFALYAVLNNAAHGKAIGVLDAQMAHSAANARILGAPISASFLSADGQTAVQVLAVVMIILMSLSQFYTQRQLMTKNMTPEALNSPFMQQQKMLMYVFPVIFAVSGVYFPIGVLVYWLTSNAWTMVQQVIVIRRMPAPGSQAEKEMKARQEAKARRRAERAQAKAPVQTKAAEPASTPASTSGGTSGAAGGRSSTSGKAPAKPGGQRQQPTRKPRSKRSGRGPKR
ncbi:membrane protein insertase YidC [Carbonactinospora thermoautotrophica]|uniref:Membrane protein insertase YidC n=1 Tax=Carbonactinospora thermoautotrophica TaxID=1469144 RepID=A0A132MKV7_9ACTN|nr:membrane protein insertase YidC [Carbonactinospora thermoautotrophica]KWW98385.1 Membrane protein oxaA [Carbonactinospora thermoautotrophica]MCX9192014.1 membrane protein insertase YidC [Carbonactinospora thermoautotrophica]